MEVKVLDHGVVQLLDTMPQENMDMEAVRAARISYGDVTKGEEADKKLLKYLIEHKHESVFEHCIFKFRIEAPVVVWWQFVRHRIVSYNFQSGRYTELKDVFYVPTEDQWRLQSTNNKQGSEGVLDSRRGSLMSRSLNRQIRNGIQDYEDAISIGVAKEQARLFLPAWCLYYSAYVTMNARSLIHFIQLRADSHAQWEIQEYARAMLSLFREKMPLTAEHYFGVAE